MNAEEILKLSLRDRAREELLKAGHYDDLNPEWNPEKENKTVEELVEFLHGRVDGHWEALEKQYEIPWDDLEWSIGETNIQHNLKLLKMARDGKFPDKSENPEVDKH